MSSPQASTTTALALEPIELYMGIQCEDCGETFEKKRQLIGHARGDCNPDLDGRETRTCAVCGDEFKDYPSHDKQTCSKACADIKRKESNDGVNTGIGGSVEVECENCGEEFTRWKSQVEAYDHQFCGNDCKNEWRREQDGFYASGGGQRDPDHLDHTVRSGWEEGVAELLVENNIQYKYEPEKFDLGDERYVPDFRVGQYIIEVKGRLSDSPEKLQKLKMERPEFTTVAVGAPIEADVHISYENREQLLEVVQ